MTIAINNRTFVGIANLTLQRASDGVVLCWPKPSRFVVGTGTQQKIQMSRDEQGREVRVRSYVTGAMPELTISYQHIQPEMISFQVGNQMAVGTYATYVPKLLVINKGQYSAAASGYLGFGITADNSGARASITRNSLTFPLTQQTHANYSSWRATNDCFSLGADGALNFSDNLVTAKEVCALQFPYTVTGRALSDIITGDHRVVATLVNTENQITIFEGYSATPNVEGGQIDASAEGIEIKLFLNNPPGECRAWNVIDTSLRVACGS